MIANPSLFEHCIEVRRRQPLDCCGGTVGVHTTLLDGLSDGQIAGFLDRLGFSVGLLGERLSAVDAPPTVTRCLLVATIAGDRPRGFGVVLVGDLLAVRSGELAIARVVEDGDVRAATLLPWSQP